MFKNLFIFLFFFSTSAFLQSMEISDIKNMSNFGIFDPKVRKTLVALEKDWELAEGLKDRLDKEDLLKKERKIIAGYFTTLADSAHKNVLTGNGTWIRHASQNITLHDFSLAPLYATRPKLPIEMIHHIFSFLPHIGKPCQILEKYVKQKMSDVQLLLSPRPLERKNLALGTTLGLRLLKEQLLKDYEALLISLFKCSGSVHRARRDITSAEIKNAVAPAYNTHVISNFIAHLKKERESGNRSPLKKLENLLTGKNTIQRIKIDQLQGMLDRCAQDEAEYTKEQEEKQKNIIKLSNIFLKTQQEEAAIKKKRACNSTKT